MIWHPMVGAGTEVLARRRFSRGRGLTVQQGARFDGLRLAPRRLDDLLHHAEDLFLKSCSLCADARRVRHGFEALRALVVNAAKGRDRRDALVLAARLRNPWHNSYLEAASVAKTDARTIKGNTLPPSIRRAMADA